MKRLLLNIGFLCMVSAGSLSREEGQRAFPIFSIVKFKNDECDAGNDRLGTCYTREECENRSGNPGNSCAEGFGICCEFRLVGDEKCGQSVAQNNTYIVEEGRTESGMCNYEICPCSDNICRIRFDFTQLDIADQTVGTTTAAGLAADVTDADSIGHCAVDTFTITGVAGSSGSPIICGPNQGQHMILDNDGKNCHTITFNLGTATENRQWDIVVTQYDCNNAENLAGGPPGCLQYFHDPTLSGNGWLVNYGANAIAQDPDVAIGAATPAIDDMATHLANQDYDICIRRVEDNCRVCYEAKEGTPAAGGTGNQAGFGLSLSPDGLVKSNVDTACKTDYLEISAAQPEADTGIVNSVHKVCGRFLNTDDQGQANIKLCSRGLPFRVGVNFDGSEEAIADADADMNERFGFPGGIVGFRLRYEQTATICT